MVGLHEGLERGERALEPPHGPSRRKISRRVLRTAGSGWIISVASHRLFDGEVASALADRRPRFRPYRRMCGTLARGSARRRERSRELLANVMTRGMVMTGAGWRRPRSTWAPRRRARLVTQPIDETGRRDVRQDRPRVEQDAAPQLAAHRGVFVLSHEPCCDVQDGAKTKIGCDKAARRVAHVVRPQGF